MGVGLLEYSISHIIGQMLPKFVLLLFVLPYFVQGESLFSLENRWPVGPLTQPSEGTLNLKKGSGTTLSCTSTEKFNLCRWARPNVADSCSIFGHVISDTEQSCSTDGWSITKLSDGKTCKLNIESSKESDSGKWVCYLESYPSKTVSYTSVEAATMVTVIEPPIVELKGPSQIPVTLDTKNQFMCIARGSPKPTRLEWTIGNNPMTILDSQPASGFSLDGDVFQMIVSATVLPEWIGKELKCTAVTLDDAGNELRGSDTRTLQIIESRGLVSGVSWGDSGQFRIVEREPPGQQGEIPSILVAPGSEITFSCTSSVPWDVCRFQRPNSDQPCGLLSYDVAQRTQCRMVWSDYSVSPGEWFLRKESPTKCSITGMAANVMDEGVWNCHLQSKPILGPHSTYDSDQGDFSMRVIRPPRLQADNFPMEIKGIDGDTIELSISVSDANPAPRVDWFVNYERAMITILEQSDLVYNSLGSVSFTQKIQYIVHEEDSGKKLTCKVVQFDTFGKEVVVSLESLLTIKARPPPLQSQGLNVTIIGVIVAIAAFIVLAIILLLVAFRTGKLCFKKPQERPVDEVDRFEMEAQTESGLRHEIGIGADFGPDKPRRVELATREETAPLIIKDKKTQSSRPDIAKADKFMSGNDELLIYTIEGQCSPATSLSSINTYVPDKDWTEALRTLGLGDMVGGSSQESLTESESGTEI